MSDDRGPTGGGRDEEEEERRREILRRMREAEQRRREEQAERRRNTPYADEELNQQEELQSYDRTDQGGRTQREEMRKRQEAQLRQGEDRRRRMRQDERRRHTPYADQELNTQLLEQPPFRFRQQSDPTGVYSTISTPFIHVTDATVTSRVISVPFDQSQSPGVAVVPMSEEDAQRQGYMTVEDVDLAVQRSIDDNRDLIATQINEATPVPPEMYYDFNFEEFTDEASAQFGQLLYGNEELNAAITGGDLNEVNAIIEISRNHLPELEPDVYGMDELEMTKLKQKFIQTFLMIFSDVQGNRITEREAARRLRKLKNDTLEAVERALQDKMLRESNKRVGLTSNPPPPPPPPV